MRFFESAGVGGKINLVLQSRIQSCRKTDVTGDEMADGDMTIDNNKISINVRPFEIVTLRIS